MKIDIEVPRKYVRTIPNNRFRIIQDCEGNLQTIFAISLRDDETKKLLSPNTRHSRINRRYESKITRFGKQRSVLKNGFDQRAMIKRKAFIKHQLRGSVTRPTVDTGPRLPSPRIY